MKTGANKLSRVASIVLIMALLICNIGNIMVYAFGANAYSTLGTNKALGSPILNQNFSADDWNKWEMITWGIFLSNFTTPFIDDYNSAFNLNAKYGSEGSGAKALQFGSGNDVANNQVIRDLLDYAMNQQTSGSIKQIYVSYNRLENGELTKQASFSNDSEANSVETTPAEDSEEDTDEDVTPTISEDDVTGAGVSVNNEVRAATVKDLFFTQKSTVNTSGTPNSNTTWIASSDTDDWVNQTVLKTDNYVNFVGTLEAEVPTFAVKTMSGGYETVLNYTDSYDLSIMSAVVTRGLCGDYSKEFTELVDKVFETPESYPIVLDCFGNICTQIDGTYHVIVPAAANKYLTSNPSINLVNSLIFNACTSTVSQEQIIMNGGQSTTAWYNPTQKWVSGVPAFNNGSSGIVAGSTILYYDTDTIVYQDAKSKGLIGGTYEVNTGDLYTKLFNLDINNASTGAYSFKIEPANLNELNYSGFNNKYAKRAMQDMAVSTTQLVNIFNTQPNTTVLSTLKTDTGTLNIFDEPIVVSVQLPDGKKTAGFLWWAEKDYSKMAIHRQFVNWTYQAYKNNIETSMGVISSSDVKKAFSEAKTPSELYSKLIINESTGRTSTLFNGFVARRTDFFKINDLEKLRTLTYSGPNAVANMVLASGEGTMLQADNLSNNAFSLSDSVSNYLWDSGMDENDKLDRSPFGRSVKVYSTSEVMRSIANILGVREGTEFAVYSTYIYLTYLDWYGITGSSIAKLSGTTNTSKLNPRIFDENSDVLKVNLPDITNAKTNKEKDDQIRDWTYMMLNPTEGREYRSQMIISGISDWIYDNYQKIVYGNASSYYDMGTGVTSRNSTGFMTVPTYADNFMTSWFIGNYAYFTLILLGAFLIITLIVGIMRKKKSSWFLTSIFALITMILILPSSGEIVPLISNNFVQSMFSDKMQYWAISESVTNATMESDYVSGNSISSSYMVSLTASEQAQVINMVKNLNSLYVDRSINIKQDISKKITSTGTDTYEEVQQLASARWLLPMIMRQFTPNDGSANYVYVPLGDKNDDLSNLYWYFKPEDAAYVSTVNAKQAQYSEVEIPSYNSSTSNSLHQINSRTSYFSSYVNSLTGYSAIDYAYKQKSYEIYPENNVHTYSYFIPEMGLINAYMPDSSSYDSYDDWAKAYANNLSSMADTANLTLVEATIERTAGTYSRFDRTTMNENFGYLWTTENPFHYFYQGVKDSFEMDSSLGSLVGELQGTFVMNDTGEEVPKSFMYANETGYVRDILDLEEMFTNMIPYLYSVQLLAEGYDGVGGVFEDGDLIIYYPSYTQNDKSWLFRSNWVTKLMENKDYHTSSQIKLADGTKTTVANMMLPSCYLDAGRPMVFSEAQMHKEGLTDDCLSLIELKCIQVNKDAMKQWTLMLNYVAVSGMTREVMIRQMALDALLIFNAEFSPTGVLSGAYTMYPNGIDLRSISFDTVMKMLMLNVTHDTSYIYGDTMQTMVEDSDIFTAMLLLITAFICAFLIPLARNFVLGLIFFLGIWSMLWSVLKSNKAKAKISGGWLVSNVVFLAMTLGYYLLFKLIMAMTTTDEILSLQQVEINTGNPVWCLIFVLVISLVYCFGIYKMAVHCIKHYRDMGFEVYAGIAEMAAGGISFKIEQLGNVLAGLDNLDPANANSVGRNNNPIAGVVAQLVDGDDYEEGYYNDTRMGRASASGSGGLRSSRRSSSRGFEESASSYTDGRKDYEDGDDYVTIDEQIEKGRQKMSSNKKDTEM